MSTSEIPDDAAGILAIEDLAVHASEPMTVSGTSDALAYVFASRDPAGKPVVVDLQELRDKHRRALDYKRGTYTVTDVDSFLEYYAKHAEPEAEIWVNAAGARAVLNAFETDPGEEGWNPEDHILKLQLTASPEWARWAQASGRMFKQDEFAEWLQSAARDIVQPDFATVLEVAQSLEATAKVDFKSAYRTSDGQRGFRYEETTTAKAGQKGDLEIPSSFEVAVRPYIGQEPRLITARFRYRIQGDALLLGIVIDRIPEILEEAVAAIRLQISGGIATGNVFSA